MNKKTIVALLLSVMSASMLFGCNSTQSYDDIRSEIEDDIRSEIEDEIRDEKRDDAKDKKRDKDDTSDETDADEADSDDKDGDDISDDLTDYTSIDDNTTPGTGSIPGDDFNHDTFDFDGKHVVLNGTGFTFGGTCYRDIYEACTALDYNIDGDRDLYASGETVAVEHSLSYFDTNITGGMCEFEVVNKGNDDVYLRQCVLQRVTIHSNYENGLSLADNGYTFNIGSKLTESSSYEEFESEFGTPDAVVARGELETAIWDDAIPGASLEVSFIEGGRIALITFTGDIY